MLPNVNLLFYLKQSDHGNYIYCKNVLLTHLFSAWKSSQLLLQFLVFLKQRVTWLNPLQIVVVGRFVDYYFQMFPGRFHRPVYFNLERLWREFRIYFKSHRP